MREIKLDNMLFNTISKRPKAVENCILLIVKFINIGQDVYWKGYLLLVV